jgi:hypothetical protein
MSDLNFQDFSTVQSDKQPKPVTIASAATISPTTRFSRISGSTPITTITPPVTGYHELVFIFDNATVNALNTGGNIQAAYTAVVNRPVTVYYDPRTALYYVMTVA